MQRIILILFTLFICVRATAQSQAWLWARSGINTDAARITAITTSRQDNIYAIGTYSGAISIDTLNLTANTGANALFLLKLNACGQILWVRDINATDVIECAAIAVDDSENVYCAGRYTLTANFQNNTITSVGGKDVFVAKYNANGQNIWVKSQGSPHDDIVQKGITVDQNNNLIVAGYFGSGGRSDSIAFGTFQLKNVDRASIFLVKYSPGGSIAWARKAGDKLTTYCWDIAVNRANEIVVLGNFLSRIYFDSIQLNSISTGFIVGDVFVAKYDSAGNAIWAKAIGGIGPPLTSSSGGTVYASCLATDQNDNIFVGGVFSDCRVKLGAFTLSPMDDPIYSGDDIWIGKMDKAGNFVWARRAGGYGTDHIRDIATDATGNVYIGGDCGNNAAFETDTCFLPMTNVNGFKLFACRFDSSGQEQQLTTIDGSYNSHGQALAISQADQAIITGGDFYGPFLKFGSTQVYNSGSVNGFIARVGRAEAVVSPNSVSSVEVYPNPASQYIEVRTTLQFDECIVTDLRGRVMNKEALPGKRNTQQRINLDHLPDGVYNLTLLGSNGAKSTRFIKCN